jgi:hypothetical protein
MLRRVDGPGQIAESNGQPDIGPRGEGGARARAGGVFGLQGRGALETDDGQIIIGCNIANSTYG